MISSSSLNQGVLYLLRIKIQNMYALSMHIVNFPSRHAPILCKYSCIGQYQPVSFTNDQLALSNNIAEFSQPFAIITKTTVQS